MGTYVIGDVHGCYKTLCSLLKQINFQPHTDQLWFVGDLVNRGPRNISVLKWLYDHQNHIKIVLGNHDLFLLAAYTCAIDIKHNDTIDDVLYNTDAKMLMDWLRKQSLAHYDKGHLMIHAGALPVWNRTTLCQLAGEVQTILRSDTWKTFMKKLYGNIPEQWNDALTGYDRYRTIVNALTRLRICSPEGVMNLLFKQGPSDSPNDNIPWFTAPNRQTQNTPILFGHWSALGVTQQHNVISLDSGCVWNGKLTCYRLEDKKIFQTHYADGH